MRAGSHEFGNALHTPERKNGSKGNAVQRHGTGYRHHSWQTAVAKDGEVKARGHENRQSQQH
jgi:hypothetical protein